MKVGSPGNAGSPKLPARDHASVVAAELRHAAAEKILFEKQRAVDRLGPMPDARARKTLMGTLRKFSVEHPVMSVGAALASIGALAGLLGWISELAVDKLAHMTNRKNDRVGEVVGAFVGCAVAFTHTLSLFGAWRRMDIKFGLRNWRPDASTGEGASLALITKNALPLRMAIIRNAKREQGVPHNQLDIKPMDVRHSLKYIEDKQIPESEWRSGNGHDGYLVAISPEEAAEMRRKGIESRPGCTAWKDIPALGIKKGWRYESRYDSANDVIGRDLDRSSFDANHDFIRQLMIAAKSVGKSDGEKLRRSDGTIKTVRSLLEERGIKSGVDIHQLTRELSRTRYAAEFLDSDTDVRRALLSKLRLPEHQLNGTAKTWIRVDELVKVMQAMTGMRPASLHGWIRNLTDTTAETMDSATNTMTQGRNIGTVLFSYIPMSLAVSVITVLCLGMSSNSANSGQPGTSSPRKKHGHDADAANIASGAAGTNGSPAANGAAAINSAVISNSGYGSDPLPLAPTPAMESAQYSTKAGSTNSVYSQSQQGAQNAMPAIGVPTPQLVG